jgi:hypothetical protein
MGAEQKKVILFSWILGLVFVSVWSVFDSLRVVWATSRHYSIKKSSLESTDSARADFRRSEQKYFLDYGIYIPLEDIMLVEQLPLGGARYSEALVRGCRGLKVGSGVAIWLPLKTKWPLFGEKVIEWCWKPPVIR